MKNREKYREEIIKSIKSRETCEFMNDTVIPEFIGSKTDSKCICEMGDCRACLIRFTLWLDEEYIEPQKPEVDWDNIAVDTPILVKNKEYENWRRRYFAAYQDGVVYAWVNGKTSWSENDNKEAAPWSYVELAESEEK